MPEWNGNWFAGAAGVLAATVICASAVDSMANEQPLGDRLAAELSLLNWATSHRGWSRATSDNFTVVAESVDARTARQLALKLEFCLELLQQAWRPAASPKCWSPQCLVVVHRDPEHYDQAVGKSGWGSWGSSRVSRHRGRITQRRIDLCAPTLRSLTENLPHELAHIVLSDEFTHEPAPRWLDEGAAVLAEAGEKIQRRIDAANEYEEFGLIFRSTELLQAATYPEDASRDHFYAESCQLAQVLLSRGDASQLVSFAKSARENGYESALREVYEVQGVAQLDTLRQAQKKMAGLSLQASRERLKNQSWTNVSYRTATSLPPAPEN